MGKPALRNVPAGRGQGLLPDVSFPFPLESFATVPLSSSSLQCPITSAHAPSARLKTRINAIDRAGRILNLPGSPEPGYDAASREGPQKHGASALSGGGPPRKQGQEPST